METSMNMAEALVLSESDGEQQLQEEEAASQNIKEESKKKKGRRISRAPVDSEESDLGEGRAKEEEEVVKQDVGSKEEKRGKSKRHKEKREKRTKAVEKVKATKKNKKERFLEVEEVCVYTVHFGPLSYPYLVWCVCVGMSNPNSTVVFTVSFFLLVRLWS